MKTIEVLKKLDKETEAKVYIVGGFVRDYLRNKPNKDLDVIIRNLTLKKIKQFLVRYGKIKRITLSRVKNGPVITILLFKAHNNHIEAQITLPKKGKTQAQNPHNTLKQDVKFRDFRINALYLPINYKSKKDIIDLVGGKEDIGSRKLCSNGSPNERIKESPIRMLRAVSLAARINYSIDIKIIEAIKTHAYLVKKIPAELVRSEFNKILMSKNPSKYIRVLQRSGLLKYIAPEIQNCVGVAQNKKYHKYDVFTHLIYTVNNSEFDLVLRLAGLLHDIGKPVVKKRVIDKEGKVNVTFHTHEVASARLALVFLKRLKYDKEVIGKVVALVRLHMYHYTREWTDTALRRFIKRVKIDEHYMTPETISSFPLFKLRAAERLGGGKVVAVTDRQKDFEERVIDVYNSSRGLVIKDLELDGNIIMEVFNLKPGVKVGQILEYLLDKILEEPHLNNKLDLLKLTTEYLYSNEYVG